MLWLIVPLLVVVVLFFAGFRKTAGAVLVAALIAAGVLYWLDDVSDQRSMSRISSAEAFLKDVKVRRTFDSTYELTGTMINKSAEYEVDGITIAVRLRDCRSAGETECEGIGEATADVRVSVPPGQANRLVATFYLGKEHRPAKGTLAWDHEITAIRASRP